MEASSKKDLISILRSEGLVAVSIEDLSSGASPVLSKSFVRGGRRKRVRIDDIAIFCRQLATLVNAGVNLLEGIEDVSDMSVNPSLRDLLRKVASSIREGSTLSDAMSEHKVFNKTLVAMVSVGEKTGKLAKVLSDLAVYLESAVKLQRQVKAASTYPIFVGGFFALVLLLLVLVIIPKFDVMFQSFGADLPLPTQMVMNVSNFVINNFILMIVLLVALIIGFKIFKRSPGGRYMYDKALFKLPIFGNIYTKIVLARFFQTFATLVKSGIDIIGSIDIAMKVPDNAYIEGVLTDVKEKVMEGNSLGDELSKHKIFPRMISRMTAVGEKSGQLDAMFEKITDYYTDEVNAAVSMLSSIIEPVLIVFLGFIVGIVVVAMYLPIFRLAFVMMQ